MREHVTVMAQWQAGNWVHSFMHMVQVDWCFRWITWLFEWLWGGQLRWLSHFFRNWANINANEYTLGWPIWSYWA